MATPSPRLFSTVSSGTTRRRQGRPAGIGLTPGRSGGWAGIRSFAWVVAAALALPAGLSAPAQAIPRLDLTPYPAPVAAERRWVIQLPGVLPPSTDARLSANPADWRVELLVGKELLVDCNGPRLMGRIRRSSLPGTGYSIYRVTQVSPPISTRMACPPDRASAPAFVPMGSKPFVVPYNVSQPIVIYAPSDLEVRWRLWKAERRQQNAMPL
jgi:ecotin